MVVAQEGTLDFELNLWFEHLLVSNDEFGNGQVGRALLGHLGHLENQVSGVGELPELQVEVFRQIGGGVSDVALVDLVAFVEEEEAVELVEELGRGLVDGADDGEVVPARLALEHADDPEGGGAVEAAGRLVTQQQVGVSDELVPNTGSLPLTPRQSFLEDTADDRLAALLQSQPLNNAIYLLLDLPVRELGPQLRREPKGLLRRERVQEHIVLLDKGSKLAKIIAAHLLVIDPENASALRSSTQAHPLPQNVEERGLATAAGAHDRHNLARLGIARHIVEDLLPAADHLLNQDILLVFISARGAQIRVLHPFLLAEFIIRLVLLIRHVNVRGLELLGGISTGVLLDQLEPRRHSLLVLLY
mmetsp:Transcript_416/g.831  ORF Transcript_416/g.831 Transcript_416/m.831 type:complete len:361 (-) Transcript_416:239-1321(-)